MSGKVHGVSPLMSMKGGGGYLPSPPPGSASGNKHLTSYGLSSRLYIEIF